MRHLTTPDIQMTTTTTLPKAVAVIGAGTMGNGIAQTFATCGVDTFMVDLEQAFLDRGLAAVHKSLGRFVEKGTLAGDQADSARKRLRATTDMNCLAGVDLCVEAVTENLEVKTKVFQSADRLLPAGAVLASNTSSISITVLAARTKRADRVIGMHFMNPVPLMKLVEVIRGHDTSDATTAAVVDWSRALGKVPVAANDYPGFVANRILMPMINEAAFALMEGVATREAIDEIMKLGMNHPMGPLTLADFIGLDVCVSILDVLHDGFGDDKYRACPLLRRLVHAGHFGRKTGRGFYEYEQG
jgi:3-hydroxybutyryl-CoA dehydrogenase